MGYYVIKNGGKIYMKKRLLKLLAGSAFLMTLCNVNMTCFYWINQPTVPEKTKKLRRF